MLKQHNRVRILFCCLAAAIFIMVLGFAPVWGTGEPVNHEQTDHPDLENKHADSLGHDDDCDHEHGKRDDDDDEHGEGHSELDHENDEGEVGHEDHGDEAGHQGEVGHGGHDDDEPTEGHSEPDQHEAEGEVGHEDHDDEVIIEVSPEGMKLANITLAKVSHGSIGQAIDLPGEVGFDEDRLVHIAPRFGGIAKEARFSVGDYVNAGDTVAIVESNESLNPYAIKTLMSGWIIQRHITAGEFVSGENSIYIIADLSKVWVNLAVYPKDEGQIKPGQHVFIEAVGTVLQAEGIIQYVTPILDVHTRSITARVVLPNPNKSWRPGTFVRAKVRINSDEEGLVVANDAIQVLDNEPVVFVPDGAGRFRPVHVEIGDSDSRYTKIQSGLELGTEYVATGAFELKAKIVTSSLGGHAGHGH